VHRPIEIFGFSTVGRKLVKLRLGGLPAAITGNEKLYSKDGYDSNAENKVRKWGANVGFCALLAHLGRVQVAKLV
jgi:hypothetical protein